MTRKNNKKKGNLKQKTFFSFFRKNQDKDKRSLAEKLNLSEEIAHFIYALILFFLAVFFIGASFNFSGKIGNWIFSTFSGFLGIGYYLIPVLFLVLSFSFFRDLDMRFTKIKFLASIIFVLSGLGLIELFTFDGG